MGCRVCRNKTTILPDRQIWTKRTDFIEAIYRQGSIELNNNGFHTLPVPFLAAKLLPGVAVYLTSFQKIENPCLRITHEDPH